MYMYIYVCIYIYIFVQSNKHSQENMTQLRNQQKSYFTLASLNSSASVIMHLLLLFSFFLPLSSFELVAVDVMV